MQAWLLLKKFKKKNLTNQSKIKGVILHNELNKISKLKKNLFKVYGKGLIAALIFNKTIKNIDSRLKSLVEACIKDGLLMVYTGRESIKLGPPLTISKDAIKVATKIIKKNILKIFND